LDNEARVFENGPRACAHRGAAVAQGRLDTRIEAPAKAVTFAAAKEPDALQVDGADGTMCEGMFRRDAAMSRSKPIPQAANQ
jgi:hypothetical protein